RREPTAFSDTQIALLETFARQAVIAIQNVRLFTELGAKNRDLTESLEQQTATSEILRVISSSPTDVQPVFDTIARNAMRLCEGSNGAVLSYDGSVVNLVAMHQVSPEGSESLRRAFPMPPSRRSAATRAILYRQVVQVPDVLEDPDYAIATAARAAGFRSA